jgi:hypothetical protein
MMPSGIIPPGMDPSQMTADAVGQVIEKATATPVPKMPDEGWTKVDLPAGYLTPEDLLVKEAFVRELNGYDEERLSRVDLGKNTAVYVTELLSLGVESLGGEKPSKDIIRRLLIGDREALVLGIRQATYGNEVDFKLSCAACEKDSSVIIFIDKDVPVTTLDDPLKREFDVPLRNGGTAKVRLLDGTAQEAFSEGLGKKTTPEINTIMLARSVIAVNGRPVMSREDDVRQLSSADRSTLAQFIAEHQPGPQLNEGVEVPCATCGEKYPILLGLNNLFRF